jgi:hypothetical protein
MILLWRVGANRWNWVPTPLFEHHLDSVHRWPIDERDYDGWTWYLDKSLLLVWNKRRGDAHDIPPLKCKQKQLILICQRRIALPVNPKLQTWSKRNQSWTHLCTIRWWSTGPTPHRSFHDIQCFYEVSSKQLFARNNTLLHLVDKSWDHSPIICHSDLKTVEKILFLIELDRTLDCSNPVHCLILNKPMNGSCAISGILSTSI